MELLRNAPPTPPTHISLLWEHREYIDYCKCRGYILSQTYSQLAFFFFFLLQVPQLECIFYNHLRPPCSLHLYVAVMKGLTTLAYFSRMWWWLVRTHVETSPQHPPQLLPSWKHKVVFTQEERFSALVLIIWRFIVEDKLYHAPFTAWMSTPRGLRYLFELMRDIMERFRSCHRCVTHVTQPQCVPLRRSSYLQLISRAVTAANVQHLHSVSLYICTLIHTRYWIHATRRDCM